MDNTFFLLSLLQTPGIRVSRIFEEPFNTSIFVQHELKVSYDAS